MEIHGTQLEEEAAHKVEQIWDLQEAVLLRLHRSNQECQHQIHGKTLRVMVERSLLKIPYEGCLLMLERQLHEIPRWMRSWRSLRESLKPVWKALPDAESILVLSEVSWTSSRDGHFQKYMEGQEMTTKSSSRSSKRPCGSWRRTTQEVYQIERRGWFLGSKSMGP